MEKKQRRLGGIIPALITPMKESGQIDYAAMEKNIDFLSQSGVHGFFVNGTTAEGPILSRAEKKESVRLVKELSAGRQAVCAACIAPEASLVIEEIRELEPIEPDYVVCVTPFYFPVSQEVILDHYEKICRSTELPVIFYDIPHHTYNPISLDTRKELVKRGIGVGFKDSTGNFVLFSRSVTENDNDQFVWIQGDDLLDAYSVQIGAKGVVTGLSNISPKPYVDLFAHAERRDWDGMLEAQKRINRMGEVITAAGGRVIPGIKAAMAYQGRCEPWLRHKGLTATDAETTVIKHVMDSLEDIVSLHPANA